MPINNGDHIFIVFMHLTGGMLLVVQAIREHEPPSGGMVCFITFHGVLENCLLVGPDSTHCLKGEAVWKT